MKNERAGVAILISTKIDFMPKILTRIKEDHWTMTKRSIHQENLTIIIIYASNIRAPEYIEKILIDLKGEIENSTMMVEDFNIPLLTIG